MKLLKITPILIFFTLFYSFTPISLHADSWQDQLDVWLGQEKQPQQPKQVKEGVNNSQGDTQVVHPATASPTQGKDAVNPTDDEVIQAQKREARRIEENIQARKREALRVQEDVQAKKRQAWRLEEKRQAVRREDYRLQDKRIQEQLESKRLEQRRVQDEAVRRKLEADRVERKRLDAQRYR